VAELAGFLAGGGELDSVVAADYLMAIACMGELRRRGLRVPGDVTVIGFGDGPEAEAAGRSASRRLPPGISRPQPPFTSAIVTVRSSLYDRSAARQASCTSRP
jgi:hypothetical protein